LRLFLIQAVLGLGARCRGILPAKSIPRDGLWDLRGELEHPQRLKALPARLLEKLETGEFVINLQSPTRSLTNSSGLA
jgi:hypothetical protein